MTSMDDYDALIKEQVAYYGPRASEYDEWFFRRGRYDRAPELNQRWFDEVEEVRQQVRAFNPTGRVLELEDFHSLCKPLPQDPESLTPEGGAQRP